MTEMEAYVKNNKSRGVVAFAQFQSMTGKDKFFEATKVSWFNRTFRAKKFEAKQFRGTFLNIKEAPEPDVIIWENQHIGDFSRMLRTGLVTFITVILLIASFGGIIISKYYQDQAAKEYDVSICGKEVITITEAYQDYLKPAAVRSGRFGCYCFNQLLLVQLGAKSIKFPNNEMLCSSWVDGYSLSNALA